MTIEKATKTDTEILTSITKKSKTYWGYSEKQILEWSNLLTITNEYLEKNYVFKFIDTEKTIGYYSYFYDSDSIILDNLFVLPEFIGKGFGMILMQDFLNRVKDSQMKRILLDSEPNAEKFYTKFGFIKIGEIETSIPDRLLPVMELQLSEIKTHQK